MNVEAWTTGELKRLRHDPEFETEILLLEITELISERMAALGWRKADVARQLGVSRALVTKLLNGSQNMTVGTLVRVANVLGVKVKVKMLPRHLAEFIEGDSEFVEFDDMSEVFQAEGGMIEGEQIPLAA